MSTPSGSGDLISEYVSFASNNEVPAVFHRWSCITALGALLGRTVFLQHGHFNIYPNMYVMLVGLSGTRKSTAIKLIKKLIYTSGYTTIAASKSTKEKFLLDLAGEIGEDTSPAEEFILEGTADELSSVRETFVMCDEFNDFFGNNILEFISLLGNLWDYEGVYENRIKSGKSVRIPNPTVSILGGNTPTNISTAFPPEALGQGFFSRLLFIYGESNGRRIAFPSAPDNSAIEYFCSRFSEIRSHSPFIFSLSASARKLLEKIYTGPASIFDPRFESYATRRFTHLLKLSIICAASTGSKQIDEQHVIYANTLLTHAEVFMPKALGEFGRARNSDVTHGVLSYLDAASSVVPFKELWKRFSHDLEKPADLYIILQNLMEADKVQQITVGTLAGFLPKKTVIKETDSSIVDYSLLTREEREMRK